EGAEGAQAGHQQPGRRRWGAQDEPRAQQRILGVGAGGADPLGEVGVDAGHQDAPAPSWSSSTGVDSLARPGTMGGWTSKSSPPRSGSASPLPPRPNRAGGS